MIKHYSQHDLHEINKYTPLPLQTYLKLIKKQQKELNALKKKHSKVSDCFSADLSVGNAKRLLLIVDSH